ncbi:hypothetical protein [Armatimonas sp.]|uniref:hypothetical protein n=1 Tax=Armatimonas sp. TaxID=1872638 RepID=UPI0037504634
MNVEFNEFTYAFALLDSLQRSFTPKGKRLLPILPTTREEGKHGYDARLDFTPCQPLFLQFKVCERMQRGTAIGSEVLEPPFFRFKIWPGKKSAQHDALLRLNYMHSLVFYVAPRIQTTEELTSAHVTGDLPRQSLWVRPISVGPMPDEEQHYIVYNRSGTQVYRCSEPLRIEDAQTSPVFLEGFSQEFHRTPRQLLDSTLGLVRELNWDERSQLQFETPLHEFLEDESHSAVLRLELAIRHYFGCATVLLFGDQETRRT